ncbi:MAG: chloride channel protein [Eubacterium sp.]|nr:chloride channel protein [Eubacterium sp.]
MDSEFVRHKVKHTEKRYIAMFRIMFFSLILGVVLGAVGGVFYLAINYVTYLRFENNWIIFFLPVTAVVILWFYHILHGDNDRGTNLVLLSIQSDENVPLRMSALIFVSTVMSHLVGASVGREGAALQIGGAVGNFCGRFLKISVNEKKVLTMIGMTAMFSALFGTPMAAAFFPLEVVSVGIMHYGALMPCVIASFVARGVAKYIGAEAPFFDIGIIPDFDLISALKIAGLAALCGLVSIVFCLALRYGEVLAKKYLSNRYIRALILGTAVLGLTLLVGNQSYNGAGVHYINNCIDGVVEPMGFLIKIVFTVLSIVAGYRGGEIVPTFFIGASFGCLFGNIIGWEPALCAAVGMGTVFCGVTNCPVTSLLICLELFGFSGAAYFLLACAIAYMFSGYYGLYTSQKIVYSKFKSNFIDKKVQ